MSQSAARFSSAPRSGWLWVPGLYLAEGLPAALVTTVTLVMFSHLNGPAEKAFSGQVFTPFPGCSVPCGSLLSTASARHELG